MSRNWPSKAKKGNGNRAGDYVFNIDPVKDIVAAVEGLKNLKLEVGVLRGGARPYGQYKIYEKSGGNLSVGELAAIHEYGSTRSAGDGKVVRTPARSFIRYGKRITEKEIVPLIKKEIGRIITEAIGKNNKIKKGAHQRIKKTGISLLNEAGEKTKFIMQSRIQKKIPPPLAKATTTRKEKAGLPQPATPLVATGTLYQHIDFRVRDQGRFVRKK